jgi:8-oxo-dGTP diphosphatase
MTDTQHRAPIAAAIILDEGRLLLVERRVKEGTLSWQFPAGEVEDGESFEHAAVRETEEETGLVVAALRFLGERIHPNTRRRMGYVACEVLSGFAHVADSEEIASLAWVSPPEFLHYVPYGFAPAVTDYLNEALASEPPPSR